MDSAVQIPARLSLRGHEPTSATLEAEVVPRPTRMRRAVLYLIGFWILVPIVAFIPPHIPWIIGAFVAGLYFARQHWIGEYVVHRFTGNCPRCDSALTIKPGSRIRLPYTVTCYNCHHEPVLTTEG